MQNMHVNCKQIFPWTINNVMICRKMQHRIVNLNMQNKQVFAKKTCSIRTNAILSVYIAVFGGYHPVKPTCHYRGEYRGKIPNRHSKPIYLVLKPLKLQNYWRIFDRPVSSMYCKYAEYVCKLQTNLSMNNKPCHNMQKKCNIVL